MAKYFNGVDFDDNGHIKVKPAEPFRWITTVSYTPPAVSDEFKATVPKAYRANELDQMPDTDFEHLSKWVLRESHRRELVAKQKLLHSQEAYTGLSNFLLGCTQALACRAALRWGRGHRPFTHDGTGPGSKPTSGEMWNIFDVAALGDKLLKDSVYDSVVYKDTRYIVNANPMLWDMKLSTARNWLLMSLSGNQWTSGNRFCSYAKIK